MGSVSIEQLSALIDFLEANRELALGYCARTKEGRSQARRLWAQCSQILNSISTNCAQKSADSWRLYYNEFKSKLLKKIKSSKAENVATGGGPSKQMKLTPLQERLYDILGRDIGEPLPGVRHNPLSQSNQVLEELINQGDLLSQQNNTNLEENTVVEVLVTETDSEIQLLEIEVQPDDISEQQAAPSHSTQERAPSPAPTTPASRRRRPRRRRSSPSQRMSQDPDPAMREATERLEAIESMSAEATREQARAIDRLAAAVEAVAERLREPMTIFIQKS